MKVVVIGTGYVGLVQGVCLADLGNEVVCIDKDEAKINKLKQGKCPIYEPGLEALLEENIRAKRIIFDQNLAPYLLAAEVIFIAVGTPSDEDGRADLKYVLAAADELAENLHDGQIVVVKSTVPIGTCQKVADLIKLKFKGNFEVVSNPEFLREGTALEDFLRPDRIIIGGGDNSPGTRKVIKLYRGLDAQILTTNLATAETIKYASNSYLATQISFINALSRICEHTGADVTKVAEGMKLDQRIGPKAQLRAGLGYGGSCFPKDVRALIRIAKDLNTDFTLLEEVEKINVDQRKFFVDKIRKTLGELNGKTIAVWGLAFKPGTDDVREAPSIDIIRSLVGEGAKVIAYDPAASEIVAKLNLGIVIANSASEACKGAEALLVITEWNEFKEIDWKTISSNMKSPIAIDGRNILDPEEMLALGFIYISVGRQTDQASVRGLPTRLSSRA